MAPRTGQKKSRADQRLEQSAKALEAGARARRGGDIAPLNALPWDDRARA